MVKKFACISLFIFMASCSISEHNEYDMEIYEFEHKGHEFLVFTEFGKTINVLHDPDCNKCRQCDIK